MDAFLERLTEMRALVTAFGLLLCAAGATACALLLRMRGREGTADRALRIGAVTFSSAAVCKLLALMGLAAAPAATVGVANYHVFEGVKRTDSCMQCHVMHPMGTDLVDPESDTLAARHFRNRWIQRDHCHACHADYGLAGTIQSKMDGFRHLARYTTGTYTEPIVSRRIYRNANCLDCHAGTPRFERVPSHTALRERLKGDTVTCTSCHGPAHPPRAERTPGHPDYERLMRWGEAKGGLGK